MSQKRKDVEVTHVKGSGPGGQNRNKRMSGVRVVHVPTGVAIRATERRSQSQNLSHALDRLGEKLRDLAFRPKKRVATKKSKSSQLKRLQGKKYKSSKKASRRRNFDE
jgi:protein subunit release factor A